MIPAAYKWYSVFAVIVFNKLVKCCCCVVNTWNQVIPGMSLHLNCSSPCLPDGATVTWSLQPNYTSEVVYLQTNVAADYVLSADNSLVVLNVNESQHVGIFQCSYNNHILAEHTVNVSGTPTFEFIFYDLSDIFRLW